MSTNSVWSDVRWYPVQTVRSKPCFVRIILGELEQLTISVSKTKKRQSEKIVWFHRLRARNYSREICITEHISAKKKKKSENETTHSNHCTLHANRILYVWSPVDTVTSVKSLFDYKLDADSGHPTPPQITKFPKRNLWTNFQQSIACDWNILDSINVS